MLQVESLTKVYNGHGIKDVSFSVEPGDVLGIVGPNGVGKSTLLKCIAGLLQPDRGTVLYNSTPINYPAGELIGYMPEFPALPSFFTPKQTLQYLMYMREKTNQDMYVSEILEQFQITSFCNKSNHALSQGMQKRVMMAVAFMLKPPILLLDEPTNGLDTAGLILLKRIIKESSEAGKIILVSSHVLDFISAIHGKILFLNSDQHKIVENCSNSIEKEYLDYFGLRG